MKKTEQVENMLAGLQLKNTVCISLLYLRFHRGKINMKTILDKAMMAQFIRKQNAHGCSDLGGTWRNHEYSWIRGTFSKACI